MPKRLVRHALITHLVGTPPNERTEMAFRGQEVDLTEAEAARFDGFGATVPTGSELALPGTLMPLTESPGDEELIAWLLGATDTEVRQTLLTRPELGVRIEAARQHVVDARKVQLDALKKAAESASGSPAAGYLADRLGTSDMLTEGSPSDAVPQATQGTGDPAATPTTEGQGGDTPGNPPGYDSGPSVPVGDPNDGTPNTSADAEAAAAADAAGTGPSTESGPHVGDDEPNRALVESVVQGDVDDVTSFVADNPELATQVLDAETAFQATRGKEARKGIVRAVEAAAGHTQ